MKQVQVRFRNATQIDAVGVTEVYLVSRKTFVSFAPLLHSDEAVLAWIRDIFIPTGRITVVEENSKIIGMMALSIDREASWIDQFYLHPKAVKHGVGKFCFLYRFMSLGRNTWQIPG